MIRLLGRTFLFRLLLLLLFENIYHATHANLSKVIVLWVLLLSRGLGKVVIVKFVDCGEHLNMV